MDSHEEKIHDIVERVRYIKNAEKTKINEKI